MQQSRLQHGTSFDKAAAILMQELGALVGHFHGAILKATGDGFIAYVSHPGFTILCDSAVDLGLSMLVVLRSSINPSLAKASLPELKIRVGVDYGAATVSKFIVPVTGFNQIDMVSDALNRAVKIEQSAHPLELRIGRRLYELVHVQYLERAHPVDFDGATLGVTDYQVYRVV